MPIVVNGTTIPENVANVLNVNGTNITSVVCNGVTVWTQSLNLTWSGDSLVDSSYIAGIDTSGSSFRAYFINDANSAPWSSVNASGIFTANSVTSAGAFVQSAGYIASGNMLRSTYFAALAPSWITYTLASKTFSGTSEAYWSDGETSAEYGLRTSGGLIRANNNGTLAPYISLA